MNVSIEKGLKSSHFSWLRRLARVRQLAARGGHPAPGVAAPREVVAAVLRSWNDANARRIGLAAVAEAGAHVVCLAANAVCCQVELRMAAGFGWADGRETVGRSATAQLALYRCSRLASQEQPNNKEHDKRGRFLEE